MFLSQKLANNRSTKALRDYLGVPESQLTPGTLHLLLSNPLERQHCTIVDFLKGAAHLIQTSFRVELPILIILTLLLMSCQQGPTSILYSNRTRIFLSYSSPTRKFLKNYRVASSVYYSHFRKIAARPASQNYSLIDTDNILLFLI